MTVIDSQAHDFTFTIQTVEMAQRARSIRRAKRAAIAAGIAVALLLPSPDTWPSFLGGP